MELFTSDPIENKHITAEGCVHHLTFSDKDYEELGNFIVCNPSIKTEEDRLGIIAVSYTHLRAHETRT